MPGATGNRTGLAGTNWRHTQAWHDWGHGDAWRHDRDFDHDHFFHNGFAFAPFFPGWLDWFGWPGYYNYSYGYYDRWPYNYYDFYSGLSNAVVDYPSQADQTVGLNVPWLNNQYAPQGEPVAPQPGLNVAQPGQNTSLGEQFADQRETLFARENIKSFAASRTCRGRDASRSGGSRTDVACDVLAKGLSWSGL